MDIIGGIQAMVSLLVGAGEAIMVDITHIMAVIIHITEEAIGQDIIMDIMTDIMDIILLITIIVMTELIMHVSLMARILVREEEIIIVVLLQIIIELQM
jgi:hypothetical protein